MDQPKISVIVPSRQLHRDKNLRHFNKPVSSIGDLMDDLAKNVSIAIEIIVVCNGEKDKSLVRFVRKNRHIDKYCICSHNCGVSRAWNMGRMLAEGETLCFINDDVRIGKGALEKMHEVLTSNQNVGEVGPKGGKWDCCGSGTRTGQTKIEEADEVSGFCFMTKTSVFDAVFGFDVFYTPAGCEEVDFSFKVRQKGFKCLVVPGLEISTEPLHGISARNTEIRYFDNCINTQQLHEKNIRYFNEKWFPQ